MKQTSQAYVTHAQLTDYVSKFEFNEFVSEMRDFRSSTEKRLDAMDRRIDRLEETFRIQTGIILQEMRSIAQTTIEYLKHIEERLGRLEERMDRMEQRLELVEARLGGVEGRLENVEGRLVIVEERLGNVEERVGNLEESVESLKNR